MPPRTNSHAQKFDAASLQRFGQSLLTACGLVEDRARDVAEVLLEGDLLGHTTHGFALLPAYLKELKEGMMEKTGEPNIIADHGSALTWDGRHLPGPWLVRQAIAAARERLAKHPVVTVSIRRSHHIGCLQAYLRPVTDARLLMLLVQPPTAVLPESGPPEPRLRTATTSAPPTGSGTPHPIPASAPSRA